MTTQLWTNDLNTLFKNYMEFYPDKTYDTNRMINSIVRFCVLSIIILVITKQANAQIVGILIVGIVLSTLYGLEQESKNEKINTSEEKTVILGTKPEDEFVIGANGVKYWKAFPTIPYTKNIFNDPNVSLEQRLKASNLDKKFPIENQDEFAKYLYSDLSIIKDEHVEGIQYYDIEADDDGFNYMGNNENSAVFNNKVTNTPVSN